MQKKEKKKSGFRVAFTVAATLFAAVLFALTVLTARAAAGLDPDADAALLDELSLTGTTRLFCRTEDGEPIEYETVYAAENRIWCASDEIPDVLKHALIAIEDKRFYSHGGVDWLRTGKAFLNYVFRFDPPFGGSTITQQLVKNVSGENDVKSERKIREILRALMPKTYILVPGYGAQGGKGSDLKPFFNADGLGAIVNSSRGIIAAYKQEKYASYGPEGFADAARAAVIDMREDIVTSVGL